MKLKKVFLGALIASQILTASAFAASDEAIEEFKKAPAIKQEVKKFKDEVKIFIIKDGEKVRVDQKMTDGLRVVNGRTCLGVRDLVNAIEGAKVEWDGTNHIVDITYDGKTISYPVGKPLMWADGKAVTIDVPAQIDPQISKTFLPIRNIAETLGFKVDWDNKAKEVVLTPGAGKAQAAQTPTQNSKTKITLASGEVIDFNNPVLDKTEYDQGKVHAKYHTYYLSDKDFIDNGDGTLTFAKGTKYEQDILKQFKLVNSSPANPNFKIWGENKNDSRVGTHMLGDGSEYFERAWQERTSKKKEFHTDVFGQPYVGTEKPILRTALTNNHSFFLAKNDQNILSTIFKDRQISQDRVNEFLNNTKTQGKTSKLNLDNFKKRKFYDATGIVDMPLSCVGYNNNPKFNKYTPSATYLTTDGRLFFSIDELKSNETVIIDKVLLDLGYAPDNYSKSVFVVDIPNIKIRPTYDFFTDYKGVHPFLTPKSFSWRKLNI